jgi:hypothetical protein
VRARAAIADCCNVVLERRNIDRRGHWHVCLSPIHPSVSSRRFFPHSNETGIVFYQEGAVNLAGLFFMMLGVCFLVQHGELKEQAAGETAAACGEADGGSDFVPAAAIESGEVVSFIPSGSAQGAV